MALFAVHLEASQNTLPNNTQDIVSLPTQPNCCSLQEDYLALATFTLFLVVLVSGCHDIETGTEVSNAPQPGLCILLPLAVSGLSNAVLQA